MKICHYSLPVFVLLASLFAAVAPVSAHDVISTSTSPADRAILSSPPQQVALTFPEEAGEKTSFVQVEAAAAVVAGVLFRRKAAGQR